MVVLMAKIYYSKRIQSKTSRGNQTEAFVSLLPVDHSTHFIPPVSCDNMHKLSCTSEAHQRFSALGFYWRLVMQAPSALCQPKFQTSRKKADIQHQPFCLHKQSRHGHLGKVLYHGGKLFISHIPRSQPRASLARRQFHGQTVSGLLY